MFKCGMLYRNNLCSGSVMNSFIFCLPDAPNKVIFCCTLTEKILSLSVHDSQISVTILLTEMLATESYIANNSSLYFGECRSFTTFIGNDLYLKTPQCCPVAILIYGTEDNQNVYFEILFCSVRHSRPSECSLFWHLMSPLQGNQIR